MRLRCAWFPAAKRSLLLCVPDLDTITRISTLVERVAASFGDPIFDGQVERPADHFGVVLIHVAGDRVVHAFVDEAERTLWVVALDPGPNPDADLSDEPEPESFDEDDS